MQRYRYHYVRRYAADKISQIFSHFFSEEFRVFLSSLVFKTVYGRCGRAYSYSVLERSNICCFWRQSLQNSPSSRIFCHISYTRGGVTTRSFGRHSRQIFSPKGFTILSHTGHLVGNSSCHNIFMFPPASSISRGDHKPPGFSAPVQCICDSH